MEAKTVAQLETLVDPAQAQAEASLPILENGDHLTRDEFERRFDAMPDLKRAELLEGIVYMGSPVRLQRHGRPHARISGWLFSYEAQTPGVILGDNTSVRIDDESMPQPDLCLIIDPARGGQAIISEDDYIEGGPELVVEVSSSTVSIDLHTKLRVYRRNKVREYVVWRVINKAVDWFVLREGEYVKLAAGEDGIYRSEVFPGLWLDPKALLGRNLAGVLAVLGRGLATPEHAAFVARLDPNAGRA
jgi:Uma2 family endonuclease